jgi:hypothetical protein
MDREAMVHSGFELALGGAPKRIDLEGLTGASGPRAPSRLHRLTMPSRASRNQQSIKGGDAGGSATQTIHGSQHDSHTRITCASAASHRQRRWESG